MARASRVAVAVLAALTMSSAGVAGAEERAEPTPRTVDRIAGATRIETAVAIARTAFPTGAEVVHLARADDPADALSAGSLEGPVLLVPPCDGVPDAVVEVIDDLGPDRIVAVGGTAAVCDETLAQAAGQRHTGRISGPDRIGTAAAIATTAFPDGAEVVRVVSVHSPTDALAAAGFTDGPVLLLPRELPVPDVVTVAVDELAPQRLEVVGGPAAVPDDVLAAVAGDRPTSRLSGPDRHATAAAAALSAFPDGAATAYLARSDDPGDAVAGTALSDGPVLTVPPCAGVPATTLAAITTLGTERVVALGGEQAICPWALERAAGMAAPDQPTAPLTTDDVDLLADRLAFAEGAIRDGEADPGWLASVARWQHAIYRRLTVADHLRQPVVDRLPESLRAAAWEQITAAAELRSMVTNLKDAPPDTWRIVEPAPVDELLSYYRKAEATYGVGWNYLAAINLVETRFGKIRGTSTAGAQGPMQFMPGTWAAFGQGDVNDPHDAIMAAARYLRHNGAPGRMDNALYRYNNDSRYVRAVTRHANLLAQDPDLLAGYHQWEVWYLTTRGDVLLPVGWPNA